MKYLRELKFETIDQILWFNIKTESIHCHLTEDTPYWDAWAQKVAWDDKITNVEEISARYTERASLYKEFGMITAISYGRVVEGELKIKLLSNKGEKELIEEFFSDVEKFVAGGVKFLGGFSTLSFSVPFVSFRAMVNDIPVISSYDIGGIASWNIKHVLDVQNLLKGTSMTGLSLLGAAAAFGLPAPDEDYLPENNLTVVNLFCKYIRVPQVSLAVVGQQEIKELPLLERIYKSPQITEQEKEELKQLLKKKKVNKKDKPIIQEIVTRLYVNCEMFKSDKPEIAEKKTKEIEELINSL